MKIKSDTIKCVLLTAGIIGFSAIASLESGIINATKSNNDLLDGKSRENFLKQASADERQQLVVNDRNIFFNLGAIATIASAEVVGSSLFLYNLNDKNKNKMQVGVKDEQCK